MPNRSSQPFCSLIAVCKSFRGVLCRLISIESISGEREAVVYAVPVGISVLINLLTQGDPIIPCVV